MRPYRRNCIYAMRAAEIAARRDDSRQRWFDFRRQEPIP
jgi:hypothetical protein